MWPMGVLLWNIFDFFKPGDPSYPAWCGFGWTVHGQNQNTATGRGHSASGSQGHELPESESKHSSGLHLLNYIYPPPNKNKQTNKNKTTKNQILNSDIKICK